MKRHACLIIATGLLLCCALQVSAQDTAEKPQPLASSEEVKITALSVKGSIEGENITFRLDFKAECEKSEQEIALMSGDLVLDEITQPERGFLMRYDKSQQCYYMRWPKKGVYDVSLSFAARPTVLGEGPWREAVFTLPASRIRTIEVVCDRTDLDVKFPGALRVTRKVEEDKLSITAVLGAGMPFTVRWKPQVEELDAKLVCTSEANTIASVEAGALQLDALYVFDIAQGKLNELSFIVPAVLSVTQVRGAHIRDWRIEQDGDSRRLVVALNLPQTKQYALQILSQMTLAQFPTQTDLPLILPENELRSSGHLALGTDSAIQMVVKGSGGLTQIEGAGFPRIILDREHPRRLPQNKSFFYSYASTPYQLTVAFADIVPSFDVLEYTVVEVKEDDLAVTAQLELDVRDAPLRDVTVDVGAGFMVASVLGNQVDDYTLREPEEEGSTQEVVIHFSQPVLGRTLIQIRLELGRSPLNASRQIPVVSIADAKSERGYLAVTAESSVGLDEPEVQNLRSVQPGSVPMRVANAQFAYRFREPGWSLSLLARKKPAGVLAEAFHLVSLGDEILYGYVVVNYFISGAPVDELRFRTPAQLDNIEFIGNDVRRWSREGEVWVVKLQRKVIGDYNLAVSYSQRYRKGESIVVGVVECEAVERRTGYICMGSQLDLRLTREDALPASVLAIKRDEIPGAYRLLVDAPILDAYKYVDIPHRLSLKVDAYARGSVLPVVVDLMELQTEVNVGDKEETESITRIRYKIKNASSQFLNLSMPANTNVWGTAIITSDEQGNERRTRVAASFDAEKGLLMVPLNRNRDPNDPITVEVEYGQAHAGLVGAGKLELVAPASATQGTFASWGVHVPEDWAILPADGSNMIPREQRRSEAGLGSLMRGVVGSWAWALEDGLSGPVYWWGGMAALLILLLTFFLRRSVLLEMALAIVLLAALCVGIRAASAPSFARLTADRGMTSAAFTRVLSLEDKSPMTVTLSVTPAWRRSATLAGTLIVPMVGIAFFMWTFRWKRLRPVSWSVGLVALLYCAAQFPACMSVLGHLFTWGLVTVFLCYVARQLFARVRYRSVAQAAALILLGLLLLPGCTVLPQQTTVERAEYTLKAEKDTMSVDLRLRISSPEPARIALLDESAVLLTPEEISDDVVMERENGRYFLRMKKEGIYDVDVRFLSPLAEAGEDQLRHFGLAAPVSLVSRVVLSLPTTGVNVVSPTAIRLTKEEGEEETVARALFGPGDDIIFLWKPRARERNLEATAFFTELATLMRFDTGLAEGRHRIRFQIAQGELKAIRVGVPEEMTVTAVEGAHIGTWRFDPATHELEVLLTTPAIAEYNLTVTTQISYEEIPSTVSFGTLDVREAQHQRGILGLTTTPAVYLTPEEYGQTMNTDDFAREASDLIAQAPAAGGDLRHAYRVRRSQDVLTVQVNAVRPEVRVSEKAVFTVSDERLVYNGSLEVDIAKAGLFSVDLVMPDGYDIDALAGDEVSHWDEVVADGRRVVQVHFRRKLLGKVKLGVALSRPVEEMSAEIATPRVAVVDALKHSGQISIISSMGVRLSVAERNGISELNAIEAGMREPGALAFTLLRPDWSLTLKTEIIRPRINVNFLHVARVSDGLVNHNQYLRYQIYNAGVKTFDVQVPKGVLGLEITGPEIAHLKQINPETGIWRVELAKKRFEQPYFLSLRYETQFDREEGSVDLKSAKALNVDMQRGHAVVYATEKVELSPISVDAALQPVDARSLPRMFGAGDLSGAAFCYSSTTPSYQLALRATRHVAAAVLEADVLDTTISTIVSERGDTINHVSMHLRVGGKSYLEARLPEGAEIWSLMVNLRSQVPSKRLTPAGDEVALIPVAHASSGGLPVEVDLIYVAPKAAVWTPTEQNLVGPQFDLPLKRIRWYLYLPEGYSYDNFEGTMTVNERTLRAASVQVHDAMAYDQAVAEVNTRNNLKALQLQSQGDLLARTGRQREAKQAFEWAYNYSVNDPDLNEDTRVQLHSLVRQQAVVGIVGRRRQLRQQGGQVNDTTGGLLGTEFSREEAERLQNSLNKSDSENLERITTRLIETQEEASRSETQIMITMPLRGRIVELERPLQVKTNTDMAITFDAKRVLPDTVKRSWVWAAGLLVVFSLVFLLGRGVKARTVNRELHSMEQSDTLLESNSAPFAPDDDASQDALG